MGEFAFQVDHGKRILIHIKRIGYCESLWNFVAYKNVDTSVHQANFAEFPMPYELNF